MEWVVLLELLKTIGGAAGAIVTIVGFVSLVMKKPKTWIAQISKDANKEEIEGLKAKIKEYEEKVEKEHSEIKSDFSKTIEAAVTDRRENFKELNDTMLTFKTDVLAKLEGGRQTNVCILRHEITNIYERYKVTKKIPSYTKQNLSYLYERYEEEGGNSYVKQIYKEMCDWEVE